ncbi:MAG TPA: 50S ribosomal protein L11 methyltransferase [Polyangiaceae bacterium]|nr:50S ribosomal protein L11 methyltransferase [Polyangiaceae bacterium]
MSSVSDSDTRYPYVLVDVADIEADEASARLFELGATGIEQRDAATLTSAGSGRVVLAAAFVRDEEAAAACDELPSAWSPHVEHVVGDGWRDEWKKHFEPFRLCEGVVVRPPWRACEAGAAERVVILEPGRAFGTGLHETTQLVAEALAERRGRLAAAEVLDVGCGSGILALAALALGARTVRAIDVDPEAVAVTRENAARNEAAGQVIADTTPIDALADRYAVVIANIEAHTLCVMAPWLIARVAASGTLVLSGILAPGSVPEPWVDIQRAYAGLALEEAKTRGEWLAAIFRA